MKIIIFLVLFTVQAQYNNNEYSVVTDDLNLITRIINENDQMNISTIIPNILSSEFTNNFDLTTVSDERTILIEEQWFNVNQSSKRDFLYWKHTGKNYILTSEPRCIRQMCSVKLKYNGTLSTRVGGCLSFSLRTRGQPIGQLWIVEDQAQENTLQKIQLINKTLRIEHSLKSKIKNLSIETKILFRNSQIDAVILSNLNVNWKGSCPKHRRVPTPSPHMIDRRATFDDNFMTLSSNSITNEEFQTNQQDSTTIVFNDEITTKRSFSFVNQKNIGWFLSLITIFCFLIVLSAVGHSLWLIRLHHHFTWHVAFDTQIQFLARRSIRSSTRSDNKIATVSQIAYDILNSDLQKEQTTDVSITNSDRSTPISYYTYL